MNEAKLSAGNWALCLPQEEPVQLRFETVLGVVVINWEGETLVITQE